jgi:hypothetical protein
MNLILQIEHTGSPVTAENRSSSCGFPHISHFDIPTSFAPLFIKEG